LNSVALAAPQVLLKKADAGNRKKTEFQSLIESVLTPRSPEVRRKTFGENGIAGRGRRGAVRRFVRNGRRYWQFLRLRKPAENVGPGRIGGGRATGIQHSPPYPRVGQSSPEYFSAGCTELRRQAKNHQTPIPIFQGETNLITRIVWAWPRECTPQWREKRHTFIGHPCGMSSKIPQPALFNGSSIPIMGF
jgi:hypothetical protein